MRANSFVDTGPPGRYTPVKLLRGLAGLRLAPVSGNSRCPSRRNGAPLEADDTDSGIHLMGPCKKPGIKCLTHGSEPPAHGTLGKHRSYSPGWSGLAQSLEAEIDSAVTRLARWFPWPGRSGSKLDAYVNAAAAGLPANVHAALASIQAGPRYVLAVRGYLRHRAAIGPNWAWTAAEASAFKATAEFQEATKAIAEARRCFASLNPGYELSTANLIRPLEKQIQLWNGNDSVLQAGQPLHGECALELGRPEYPEQPESTALAHFARFLKNHAVSPEPKVATPGLSGHGQLHAVDFIIQQGHKVVASAKAASIKTDWDQAGWTEKLKQALEKASPRFEGPLRTPYEPWHYVFLKAED